jgi:hypothetical protein
LRELDTLTRSDALDFYITYPILSLGVFQSPGQGGRSPDRLILPVERRSGEALEVRGLSGIRNRREPIDLFADLDGGGAFRSPRPFISYSFLR